MPAISASAPGKAILFGEHAVVYGQPAIAVPVSQVKATTIIRPLIRSKSGEIQVYAPQIGIDADLNDLPEKHPIGFAIRLLLSEVNIPKPPAFNIRISSTIPVGGGLGSSAAVSVAVLRAVSEFLGQTVSNERVSGLAYEVEKLHHGTPSGIDNTVIAFEKPVFFVKGKPLEFIAVKDAFTLVIADTGKSTPTRETVAAVRKGRESEPEKFETIFNAIGKVVENGRKIIERSNPEALGNLMNENHSLLQDLGVSSQELDHLVNSARQAGAQGAKLSGGGKGGNIIALVHENDDKAIADKLMEAGAARTITTKVQ